MITSKQTRCNHWCWAYISRYPHITTALLAGATSDYSAAEVDSAVMVLSSLDFISQSIGMNGPGWVAAVRFVVVVPEWAR